MKKVFITGASGDIGKKLVEKYLSEGYYVIGQYCKNDTVKNDFTENCEFIQADFSIREEVEKTAFYLAKIHPDIDILINNAGIDAYGLFSEITTEEIEKIMFINLTSAMILTREIGKKMLARKKGVVLNITSIWGESGGSMEVAYSVTKGGLIAFTKALAKEWALSGIRVNALKLGFMDTKMNALFSEEDKKEFCKDLSLKRVGTPSEVAETAYFINSDACSYMTAQIIGVDGGI